MKNNLNYLISQDLDLSYFWDLSINETRIRLLGYYTHETEAYLLSKGFEKIDYLYPDDDSMVEFKSENLYATLYIQDK